MLKLLGLFLGLMIVGGGCSKMSEVFSNTNVAAQNQDDAALKQVAEHAAKNFSLAANDITVKEVALKDLPTGVRQFYVEEKGKSDGKTYNYLLFENKLYSSGIDEDFGRFLKDNKFLERKDLDANWFQTILWKLNDFKNILLIDAEKISNPSEKLKPFLPKIAAPVLNRTDNGAVYKFYTQSVTVRPVQKFEITVAPDYKVTFNREFVTP